MILHSLVKAGALAAALAVAGALSPVLAAGDSPSPADTPIVCKKPLVPNAGKSACIPCAKGTKYDEEKKICVTTNASLLDDSQLYEQGRTLALAGYYQDALDTFDAIADKNDAMVLTMIGYSKRKLGFTDEGIAIYHRALTIDPNNVNTHEYLGEGYLAAGRVDLAELELDKLEKLCGIECDQYRDLSKALAGEAVWH